MTRADAAAAGAARGAPAGLVLLDKPAGVTSHGAVMRVRRALGTRRVGHTGTLDPFATGLLLALVGPCTRLAEYFHVLPKTYEATLELGRETDTHDVTGETVSTAAWQDVPRARLDEALSAQVGERFQRPPRFSAKQTGGRRAHELARRGERVDLDPVAITVHSLEVTEVALPRVRVRTRVSTGTYVRAIARDVGRELGTGAHLVALRRTEIGPFRVDEAIPPDAVDRLALVPALDAIGWLPHRELHPAEVEAVGHGQSIGAGSTGGAEGEPIALVAAGRLVGIAERRGDGLQPRKVLSA